jgi:hypothetical protein
MRTLIQEINITLARRLLGKKKEGFLGFEEVKEGLACSGKNWLIKVKEGLSA